MDLVITNMQSFYNKSEIIAPIGTSDHNVIKWHLVVVLAVHGPPPPNAGYVVSPGLDVRLLGDGLLLKIGLQTFQIPVQTNYHLPLL